MISCLSGIPVRDGKGYDIKELIGVIAKIMDPSDVLNLAIVGYGHLGKAISSYLVNKRPNLKIVAAFDIDPKKIGSATFSGCMFFG